MGILLLVVMWVIGVLEKCLGVVLFLCSMCLVCFSDVGECFLVDCWCILVDLDEVEVVVVNG